MINNISTVPRSKARVIGGERIEIRGALFGELDGARADGVEMFQSLSQAGETASRLDRLRRLRPLGTILNQRRKVGFSLFVRARRGSRFGLLQPSQKSLLDGGDMLQAFENRPAFGSRTGCCLRFGNAFDRGIQFLPAVLQRLDDLASLSRGHGEESNRSGCGDDKLRCYEHSSSCRAGGPHQSVGHLHGT